MRHKFLLLLVLLAAIGSSFTSKNSSQGDVWYRDPITGVYIKVCRISGNVLCPFASLTYGSHFYYENADGSLTLLDNGTTLYRLQ